MVVEPRDPICNKRFIASDNNAKTINKQEHLKEVNNEPTNNVINGSNKENPLRHNKENPFKIKP